MRQLLVVGLVAFLVPASAALAGCRTARRANDPMLSPEMVRAIDSSRVVCVGESHDDRAHHDLELAVLRAMTARGDGPLLLGMEMFQRPFQRHLDDYVAGRIDEKEMLRRTQYFDRWRFDHTFYAPLWRWCREHGVRVVALNAEKSVIGRITSEGLAALLPEERCQVAEEIDLAVPAHRRRILDLFASGAHKLPPEQAERYYQSMTTWDETMAESAARALEAAGPRSRMLVVAGTGHIELRTGIPDRVAKRLPGAKCLVIVARTAGRTRPGEPDAAELGDFAPVLPARDEPPPCKLGVTFASAPEFDGLRVLGVIEGGAAARAGVLEGDVLARLGPGPVTDLVDVRWMLDAARAGDVVPAQVVRDGRRVDLAITMAPPPPAPSTPAP